MRYILGLLIFFLSFSNANSQTNLQFPDDVLGLYSGDLIIDSPKGLDTIPMQIEFAKTDTSEIFTYTLTYADQPRNYQIKVIDQSKGVFLIDEQNGIELMAKYYDNTLYSYFKVDDNFLTTRMVFYKDSMEFEIVFINYNDRTVTGAELPYEIHTWPLSVIQKAVLLKKN